MSSDIAISVKNITKTYQIYSKPQDRLKQSLWRSRKQFYREFKALDNVSFEVKKGETIGIIGRNGSGKSTLLQVICGTLAPTNGNVDVNGCVAALLELGSGFNPEFEGIENIYLYGQILGLTRERIDEILPDILSFAEIGNFVYQPVKTYSSGMMLRLAFAVSVAREPEILVIDEALAVGDEAFQRRCFARINQLRESGTTVLFVSHAAALVVELCDRAVLLDSGKLLYGGRPKDTVAFYQKILFAPSEKKNGLCSEIHELFNSKGAIPDSVDSTSKEKGSLSSGLPKPFMASGMVSQSRMEYEQMGVSIKKPSIETLSGEPVNHLVWGEDYIYAYKVFFEEDASDVQFGMLIKTVSGLELGGGVFPSVLGGVQQIKRGSEISVRFKFRCALNPGAYFLNTGVRGNVNGQMGYLHRIIDAVMFKVQPCKGRISTGIVNFDIEPFIQ